MAFDPDAYLAKTSNFDPDAYLAGGAPAVAPKAQPSREETLARARLAAGSGYGSASPDYATVLRTGLTDIPVAIGEMTGLASPEYIRQREAQYQAAAANVPAAGLGRAFGGGITGAPLALIPGAPAGMGLMGRVGIGAATGAGLGAIAQPTSGQGNFLTEKGQQMLGGALVGAGLPVVGAGLGKGANWMSALRDRLSPDMNALRITREALGNDPARIAAVQAANAAQPNMPAGRIAAGMDVGDPTYQATIRMAERVDPASQAWRAAEVAREANRATLATLAGGETQTQARASVQEGRKALNKATTPLREEAFADIDRATTLMQKGLAARGESAAAVQDVRKFTDMTDRAIEWAKNWRSSLTSAGTPAAARPPVRYTYPGELAERAEDVATSAAEQSLKAGAKARAAENTAEFMRARGVEPLQINTLTDAIDAQLRKPEIIANQQLTKALTNVKEMALGFARGSDLLGAPEYYALRKNGIDSAVRAALGQQGEASAAKKLTASILTTVKNAVDPKLGPKFKMYLDAYSEGARELSKQKLAAEALKLYEQGDKKAFINLVQGNDPKRVLKIMGGGVEDIAEAMGAAYPKLAAIAKQTQEEITANARASEGATALTGVLARNQLNARIPNSLSPKIMVANKVLSGLEGKVNAKTMMALTKAAQSGASMNDLLMMTPPSERSAILSALRNIPQTANAMSPFLINRLAPTAPSGVQQQ